MKLNQKVMDVVAIKQSIDAGGELRVYLQSYDGVNGGGCRARIWHPDGFKVGHATGCGYDRQGAALGEAIELLFPAELAKLAKRGRAIDYDLPQVCNPSGSVRRDPKALYGLFVRTLDGKRKVWVDGGCGLSSMLALLEALGFRDVREVSTGKWSTLVLATGRKLPSLNRRKPKDAVQS